MSDLDLGAIDWLEYYRDYGLVLPQWVAWREHIQEAADSAFVEPGHRVLDTGCGTGHLLKTIRNMQPTAELVGLDGEQAALDFAANFLEGDNVQLSLVDLNDDDWGVRPGFDRVLSTMVLYALKDPLQYLSKVRPLLKPGGELMIVNWADLKAVYNVLTVQERWLKEKATDEQRRKFEASSEARARVVAINQAIMKRPDLHITPAPELSALLKSAGFYVLSSTKAYAGCAVRLTARKV